jgi:hypothetical protein
MHKLDEYLMNLTFAVSLAICIGAALVVAYGLAKHTLHIL